MLAPPERRAITNRGGIRSGIRVPRPNPAGRRGPAELDREGVTARVYEFHERIRLPALRHLDAGVTRGPVRREPGPGPGRQLLRLLTDGFPGLVGGDLLDALVHLSHVTPPLRSAGPVPRRPAGTGRHQGSAGPSAPSDRHQCARCVGTCRTGAAGRSRPTTYRRPPPTGPWPTPPTARYGRSPGTW